ncbi:type II secretion system protein [Verrucomicrobiaceae bacterium N1E253]|uniref:Type II secretion system protein n=1 Tax=Oceaniferula marina TaxID=2748318 RepID=A0A851GI34_9BACT|nr:type II secretion system protein [Oceaniferula marina]NWK56859.1 type II secretion system protein [Oceaniferula marina]
MKLPNHRVVSSKKVALPGLTLIEVTLVIVVMLTLIAVFFFSARGYIRESNRANCLTVQSKIKKTLISYGNLVEPLEKGVDYYGHAAYENSFGQSPNCPQTGGGYSVVPTDGEVVVTCLDNNDTHQ